MLVLTFIYNWLWRESLWICLSKAPMQFTPSLYIASIFPQTYLILKQLLFPMLSISTPPPPFLFFIYVVIIIWGGMSTNGSVVYIYIMGVRLSLAGSSPIFPLYSHSLVCGKNNSYFVGVKPLLEWYFIKKVLVI